MTPEQGHGLDHQLTTPPADCEEGHDWHFTGYDADDRPTYKCRQCGQESDV